jgi:hypothetical protein
MTMWNPFEQTLTTFGKQNLAVARIEAVRDLKIPDSSKKFLVEVGLPKEEVLLCKFDIDLPSFPTIEKYAAQQGRKFTSKKLLRRIGWDGGMQICLSEEAYSGHVITIDINKKFEDRFVNSSIELFGAFLALYVDEYCRCGDSSDEVLDKRAYELETKLHSLDPSVFSNSDNWWACITQQMKEGML